MLQALLASLQGWQGPWALSPMHRGRQSAPGDWPVPVVHWYHPDWRVRHGGCCDWSSLAWSSLDLSRLRSEQASRVSPLPSGGASFAFG